MDPENPGSRTYPEARTAADWLDKLHPISSYQLLSASLSLIVTSNSRLSPIFCFRSLLASFFRCLSKAPCRKQWTWLYDRFLRGTQIPTSPSVFHQRQSSRTPGPRKHHHELWWFPSAEIQVQRENFSNIPLGQIDQISRNSLVLPTRHNPKMPFDAGFCVQILGFTSTDLLLY
jgi:hypothetical protein